MLSRTLKRALLETRSQLPPTFLLPWAATFSTAVSQADAFSNASHPASETHSTRRRKPSNTIHQSTTNVPSRRRLSTVPQDAHTTADIPPPTLPPATEPSFAPIASSVRELLPILRAQGPHYITVHIHGQPYLLTEGDTIRLPFLMQGVEIGDVLRLNRAINLGSRDYTLKAPAPPPKLKSQAASTIAVLDPTTGSLASHSRVMPADDFASQQTTAPSVTSEAPHFIPHLARGKHSYIDDRLFVCRAVVMGVESEPMRIKEKTKRRQRHVRKVKSKHRYTILKIKELTITDPEV